MKRTRAVIICTSLVLLVSLVAVTVLSIFHDDATNLMVLLSTGIIPSVTSMFAYHQAAAAKESAGQAVKNTNGLLHEAIKRADDAEARSPRIIPGEKQ